MRGDVAGAAAESDEWAIDQAIAEYEAYSAGDRLSITVDESNAATGTDHPNEQVQCFRFPWPSGGEVYFCGAPGDETHWHAAYLHDAGQVVTPLSVGKLADVKAAWARIRDNVDPDQLPPPVVSLGGGVRRQFQPACGRFLVGVAQEGSSTALLVAVEQQLAVVLVEGKRRVVLDIKAPLDLREVFVDRLRDLQRNAHSTDSRSPREPGQARVSGATRSHYNRVIHGLPIAVAGGPSIPDVIWRCFKGLEHRAKALRSEPVRLEQEQAGPKRLKGKKYLNRLLHALFQCSVKGSDDLVGLTGALRDELRRHDPSLEITLEALSDTLNLLRATGTCLVTRADGERIWHIHLVGLNDPSSALHRRLLNETPIPFRFPSEATGEVLAEDDEPRLTDPTVPSSSMGGTSGHDPLEGSVNSSDAAPGMGTTDLVSGASGVNLDGEPATPPTDDATESAARLASSPLAPLLLLALTLAAWEAAPARDYAEVLALRERMVTLIRDLVHLHAQDVPQRFDPVAQQVLSDG